MMIPFRAQVLVALLVGLFMHSTDCAGQDYVDVLYLKNGSVIRGMIIEQVPNESLKIKTKDGSLFVYSMDEVLKFTKELNEPAAPVTLVAPSVPVATPSSSTGSTGGSSEGMIVRRGFVNVTQLSYGIGVGKVKGTTDYGYSNPTDFEVDNESNYVRIETVNGAWLADGLLSLGLGVGFQYYYDQDEQFGQLPLFADIRIMPISGDVVPVVVFQPGYSVGVMSNSDLLNGLGISTSKLNGFGIAAGLGLNTYLSKENAFVFSLLYDYQQYGYRVQGYGYYGYNTPYDITERSGTFRISMGLSF